MENLDLNTWKPETPQKPNIHMIVDVRCHNKTIDKRRLFAKDKDDAVSVWLKVFGPSIWKVCEAKGWPKMGDTLEFYVTKA